MANVNANNNGNLIGRLGADPKAFPNSDGSNKVFINLYVDSKRKTASGEKIEDEVQIEAFVPASTKGLGPYDYMHSGDLVAFSTHIEQKPYNDKATGKKVFPSPKVVIDDVTFLESRTTTQGRLAKKAVAAEAAPAVAVAPVETEAQELARLRAAAAGAPATVGAPSEMADAPFG